MLKKLLRRARRLLNGLFVYLLGWRGLLFISGAAGLFLAMDLVDVPRWLNILGFLGGVGALAILLSSASRSGSSSGKSEVRTAETGSISKLGPSFPMPSVTVIVTAYNDEQFVEACLDSVSGQVYPNLEVLVVDDAGRDATLTLVQRLARKDPRISIISHKTNLGLAAARNTGLAFATGEYVTFLDADDFLIGQSIQSRAVRLVIATDPNVAGSYCGWQLVQEDAPNDIEASESSPKNKIGLLETGGENPFIATAPMLRRSVAMAVGGFNETFRTGEDFDFWIRVLRQGFRFVGTGTVGVAYRQKRAGMVAEGPVQHAQAAKRVYRYLNRPMYSQEVVPAAPSPFDQAISVYERDRLWMLRIAQFVAFAQHSGGSTAVEDLISMLPETARVDVLEQDGGLAKRLVAALNRIALREPDYSEAELERIRVAATSEIFTAVQQIESERLLDLPTASQEEVCFGTLDLSECDVRSRRIKENHQSADVQIVIWTALPGPTESDIFEGGRALCVCLGSQVFMSEAVRQSLGAKWPTVEVYQARATNDVAHLAAMGKFLFGDTNAKVWINRFDCGQPTAEEETRALSSSGKQQDLSGPAVLVPIDQEGQVLDAVAFRNAQASVGCPVHLVHLGPFSDFVPDVTVYDALSCAVEVGALGIVYPHGPAIAALVLAARGLGVPVYELPSEYAVDRVTDSGAPSLERAPAVLPISPERQVSWFEILDAVRKPWQALTRANSRRSHTAASVVQRSKLEVFRDRHAGERCVIIGNGPSLNKLDLRPLSNEVTFGVNSIFLGQEKMGFIPTYYMVEDTMVMRENVNEILTYPAANKFFPSQYAEYFGDADVVFFDMDTQFYSQGSPAFGVPRFSTDFGQRAFCGQSVTILNLQLAFYMGFTEVFLIGMDFSYVIPETVIREGNLFTSTEDDPNHFHPAYFGVGKTWKDPKLDRVLASYQLAKRVYLENGRRIINATAGGALEVFERAAYHDVFGVISPEG